LAANVFSQKIVPPILWMVCDWSQIPSIEKKVSASQYPRLTIQRDKEDTMRKVDWWKAGLALTGLAVFCLVIAPGIGGAEGTKGKQSDQAGVSCVAPAKGPLGAVQTPGSGPTPVAAISEVRARVGQAAPDFEANALVNGGFKNLKLSDYKGKWVVMCFYPGDFTFV
jgi:hypothetical protein